MENSKKYLKLLSQKYPTKQAVSSEIINLSAICNLPKGTEHFMSDIHGEYEAFCHILNNCSGVIHEKVDLLFDSLSFTYCMRAEDTAVPDHFSKPFNRNVFYLSVLSW